MSSLISLPFENEMPFNNGLEDAFLNVLTIKPVIPMGITKNWNLINRAIIPVFYQSEAFQGQTTIGGAAIPGGATEFVKPGQELGSEFGLGDIVYQGFFTPAMPSATICQTSFSSPDLPDVIGDIPFGFEACCEAWSL